MAKITEEQGKSGYEFSKLYFEGHGSYSDLKEELAYFTLYLYYK